MTDRVEYRGYVIKRHGQRWRWRLRTADRIIFPSFLSLDDARAALDRFLESRGTLAANEIATESVHNLGAGHLTVADLCEAWFAWKTGPHTDEPIRPRTTRDYRRAINKHISPLIGAHDAATISTLDLKRDFFRLCTSRTFARFSRTILQQAWRWAIEEQLVARRDNPCLGVKLVRRDGADGRNRKATSIRAVTDEEIPTPTEVQKMLDWALESGRDTWWLWMYITATLGLRPSETCALRREDLDADRQLVRVVRAAPDRSDPNDWHMKTETSRRVLEVGDGFFEALEPRLPSTEWLFEARARGGGVPQRTHTATPCWPGDAPNREFRRMRRALGLPEIYHPYSLRHFVATRLILDGLDEIQVAKFLGTSVEMLQKVYANHIDRDAQREIGLAVTRLFGRDGDVAREASMPYDVTRIEQPRAQALERDSSASATASSALSERP
jgi:integrase